MKLESKQAFQAMVNYLEKYYERTKSDDIGSILSDLILLEDGTTADPAAWNDWKESVDTILKRTIINRAIKYIKLLIA